MVVVLPAILVMDGKIDQTDSIVAVVAFFFLLISLQSRRGFLEKIKKVSGCYSHCYAKSQEK